MLNEIEDIIQKLIRGKNRLLIISGIVLCAITLIITGFLSKCGSNLADLLNDQYKSSKAAPIERHRTSKLTPGGPAYGKFNPVQISNNLRFELYQCAISDANLTVEFLMTSMDQDMLVSIDRYNTVLVSLEQQSPNLISVDEFRSTSQNTEAKLIAGYPKHLCLTFSDINSTVKTISIQIVFSARNISDLNPSKNITIQFEDVPVKLQLKPSTHRRTSFPHSISSKEFFVNESQYLRCHPFLFNNLSWDFINIDRITFGNTYLTIEIDKLYKNTHEYSMHYMQMFPKYSLSIEKGVQYHIKIRIRTNKQCEIGMEFNNGYLYTDSNYKRYLDTDCVFHIEPGENTRDLIFTSQDTDSSARLALLFGQCNHETIMTILDMVFCCIRE